jgi:hypothetical protein
VKIALRFASGVTKMMPKRNPWPIDGAKTESTLRASTARGELSTTEERARWILEDFIHEN